MTYPRSGGDNLVNKTKIFALVKLTFLRGEADNNNKHDKEVNYIGCYQRLNAREKEQSRIKETRRATEYVLDEVGGQDHWKGDIVSKIVKGQGMSSATIQGKELCCALLTSE